MTAKLLTRDEFRAGVFARDGHRCVVCGVADQPASSRSELHLSAHHIVERKLWPDGGYYLDNGASLCEEHHRAAEATTLSCERVRELCGIEQVVLPPHMQEGERVDKWGNSILPSGARTRGELFDDPSVQRVLAPVLGLFSNRVKYPRTYHLPWSAGITKDDRVVEGLRGFEGQRVVVTAKMDGENTTMYRDYIHARSLSGDPHPSQSWVRALHGRVGADIPEGWRVCGENLYARHSIGYENLQDYFQVFSVWDDRNVCLSWVDTCEWVALLGLRAVPVLYEGAWDEGGVRACQRDALGGDPCEGYVVRVAGEFSYREFRRRVAKYVRADHVQTSEHWKRAAVVRNGLA